MTIAMVFPGQGSQAQGMQADLAAEYSLVQEIYAEASEVLGYDLWQLVQQGPAERLAETVVTQPAMLTAGYAAWRAWQAAGGAVPSHMAGHSLGEYTALVCAEAISFTDALKVVKKRSELMQTAVPVGTGAMAAIIGLDDQAVCAVCDDSSGIGVVEAVNFNSPGQVVIAGHKEAVNHAIARAEEVGARRAILLPVSVPSHSSLMVSAGEALAGALQATAFSTPVVSVINATDATPYSDADDMRSRLSRQVYRPVRWVDTVTAMLEAGATSIVECGPGKVLAGLIKRINRRTPVATIDSLSGLQKALQPKEKS
ncbi:MAG: ACP S-malonyltransferase [Gammaproteobacteria bacterium]|nr:ACP S-malonyltransferase [Gammaproteobacteria bacterium]MDH3429062.1 ACP S-malonyltransferase [Gammaproteobacteria bacterium]MDH3433094.1 ACP S-malonyltransferase [Gammaproteobacteria bacterium]